MTRWLVLIVMLALAACQTTGESASTAVDRSNDPNYRNLYASFLVCGKSPQESERLSEFVIDGIAADKAEQARNAKPWQARSDEDKTKSMEWMSDALSRSVQIDNLKQECQPKWDAFNAKAGLAGQPI